MDYNDCWEGANQPHWLPQRNLPQQQYFGPFVNSKYSMSQQAPISTDSQTPSGSFSQSSGHLPYRQEQQLQSHYWRSWQPTGDRSAFPAASMPTNQVLPPNIDPPPYFSPTLLPIAIPQMSKGRGVPFPRMYPLVLQQSGISEREFVDFIDTLNVVSAASPPFKTLDLAGGFIGMVPHHWAQLTSNAMKLAAMGGTAIVSKSRTDAILSEANQTVFGPKGLRVRLVTTDALMALIGFPPEKTITLPLLLDTPADQQPRIYDRLMGGLRGYVSDTIPTSLPPVTDGKKLLDKLSANQVSRDIKEIDKKILKESEKQMKKMAKHSNNADTADRVEDDIAPKMVRRKSVDRKIKKVDRKIEKVNKEAAKDLASGKHSSSKTEAARTDALLRLEKKREEVLEKGAARQKKDSSPDHYGKQKKKGADEKFVEKLIWIFIESVSNESS